MDSLDEQQYKQLHEVFRELDSDRDGLVYSHELRDYLASFNEHFTLDEVESFLKDSTVQQETAIDFPEFINTLALLLAETEDGMELTEDELRATFSSLDAQKKGFLTGNDLRKACVLVGEGWTDIEINNMIYHRKDDGRFYFEDFKALVQPQGLQQKRRRGWKRRAPVK